MMKIGLQIPRFDWSGSPQNIGPKLAEIAQTADKAGFSSLWLMDHFFGIEQGYGPIEAPMLEGYSVLPYLAVQTETIKLGLLVTGAFYRPPGVLIKSVTTLDVISGGRAYLGIGSGWYKREAEGLGVRYPRTVKERIGRLKETLQIAKHMWSGDRSPYRGDYYQLEEPLNSPQPLSQPHPPILIGGGGEKKTLRLVAEYGDACNFHLGTHPKLKGYTRSSYLNYRDRIPRLKRKLRVLKEHCINVGRAFEEIECTVLGAIKIATDAMTVDDVVDMCIELAGLGFQHLIFNMSNVAEILPLQIMGEEVIPKVARY